MPETVRIAVTERTLLRWPQRCPRCGATDFLVSLNVCFRLDVARRRNSESRIRYFMQYPSVRSEDLRIPVPMCPRHARSNQLGGALLRHDAWPGALRKTVYMSLAITALLALVAPSPGPGTHAMLDMPPAVLGIGAFGVFGLLALVWARHVAWVRPIRLDRHVRDSRVQVALLRFRDDAYARDFKLMNPVATDAPPAPRLPAWLARSPREFLFMGLVVVLLLPMVLVLLGILLR